MIFEIKHRYSGAVLFSLETESIRLCVEAAVKSRADLSRADLSRANLAGANTDELANNISAILNTPAAGGKEQP